VLEVICAAGGPVALGDIGAVPGAGGREACAPLYGLFIVENGTIKPFHRSLVQWLIYRERSGSYFVSAGKGRERLAGLMHSDPEKEK
jgi:hypothetical protein